MGREQRPSLIAAAVADIGLAVRGFARRPLLTAVILLMLALGIGSNVAIFSVANAVLFRPLPYAEPERLALVWSRLPATDVERSLVSGPDFQDYISETTRFEGFAGAAALQGTLTGDGPPEQVMNGYVTWNMFRLLGVTPAVGRDFVEDDAFVIDPQAFGNPNPDLPPGKVMLSWGLWQRRFGGDRSIIGQTVLMDGWGSEVVGVLPADFRIHLPADAGMPTNIDAWAVLPSNIGEYLRDAAWLTVVTRLKPGVTLEQAQQEMDALAARLREVHPFHARQNLHIRVAGMHRDVVSHARPTLLALLGAVGLVLLIACANVANLLLVRATSRGREIAVRAAIGSGRGRIIAQMLTESMVLAVAGGLLGLLLAWQSLAVIRVLSPADLPRIGDVTLDGRALGFTAAVALLAALLAGLAPALRAAGRSLADGLRDRGADSGGVRGNRLRTALVVTEVAFSLMLLIGAGLLVRTFAGMQRVDPGFDAENAVTFAAPVPFVKYVTSEARADFATELGDRLAAIPGVEGVGGVAPLPLAGGDQYAVGSYGRPGEAEEQYQANKADFKTVLPGYFEAMKIRLVAGRTFERLDNRPAGQFVAIIDEKLARQRFRDEDPIGAQLQIDHFNEQTFTVERVSVQIVGVVADVRASSLAVESRETIYLPYVFSSFLPLVYVVRTRADPTTLLAPIRAAAQELDPDVPIASLAPLETFVSAARAPTRFLLALIGSFAGLALVLASLGLYGVIAYSVRQRTREIGVRVAFGAAERDVVKLIVGNGMVVALAGIALGLGAAAALGRVARSVVVGVSALDPLTFVTVPALLLAVALVASYVPARRAGRIDPVEALRDD